MNLSTTTTIASGGSPRAAQTEGALAAGISPEE
jgi:hypothetical protein